MNADVNDIKVIFVDEPEDIINRLGIKGLGEIGIALPGRATCGPSRCSKLSKFAVGTRVTRFLVIALTLPCATWADRAAQTCKDR